MLSSPFKLIFPTDLREITLSRENMLAYVTTHLQLGKCIFAEKQMPTGCAIMLTNNSSKHLFSL